MANVVPIAQPTVNEYQSLQ